MQGRHYSRQGFEALCPFMSGLNYIHFFEFWWIGRKMTGRWAGWVPSWRLCLRATKSTRWAAAETAEAKKNIMTEWNNRVMISLDKKWTAITIYWLSDTFQQIQLILFCFSSFSFFFSLPSLFSVFHFVCKSNQDFNKLSYFNIDWMLSMDSLF